MKKFLKHLWICLYLYKNGFFFSSLTDKDFDQKLCGFFRLNFERGNKKEFAIVDIDFQDNLYFHVHQGPEKDLFRVDL